MRQGGDVRAKDVNRIIRAVVKMAPTDGNVQLTILARAFVVAVRSCQADPERAIELLRSLFDKEDMELVPIPRGPGAA